MKSIKKLSLFLDHSLQGFFCFSLFLLMACLLAGCNGSRNIRDEIQKTLAIQPETPFLYVLEFDHEGKLISTEEPARAVRDLRGSGEIDKVVVLSLGWSHSRDTLVPEYQKLLEKYENWKKDDANKQTQNKFNTAHNKAVFVISWESSLTGAGNFFGDLIPLPNTILEDFGKVFLPFTYWSKARLADKIGFGDLRETMLEIITQVNKGREQSLGLYGVGHSFGGRIITGMFNVSGKADEDFPPNTIKGGLLIEPALSNFELHSLGSTKADSPPYPLLVTSSRHDHANRLLFPLVNIPLNSAYLRYSESIKPIFLKKSDPNYETLSNGYDYVLFPLMFPYSALVFVDGYLFGQVREISDRGWKYLPDTLAQLPLLEIPVETINLKYANPQQPDDYWGQRHKGLFNLGAMHESAATIVMPETNGIFYQVRKYLGDKLNEELAKTARVCAATTQAALIETTGNFPNGIIPVDMSEEIDTGVLAEDLSALPPLANWTIGWLDPVGSHNDYEIPEIFELVYRLIEQPVTKTTSKSCHLQQSQ